MCTLSGRDEAPKPPANDSKQRTPDDVIFDGVLLRSGWLHWISRRGMAVGNEKTMQTGEPKKLLQGSSSSQAQSLSGA
jgi:hypothetical protein